MNSSLASGRSNRVMTTGDLAIPDPSTAADALHAAGMHEGGHLVYANAGRIGNPSYGDSRDMVFAMLGIDAARNPNGGLERFAAPGSAFGKAVAGETAGPGQGFTATNSRMNHSDLPFAVNLPTADDVPWFDVPLFPDRSLNGQSDAASSDVSSAHQADQAADFIPADPNLMD
jgi:hypothetical protein